MSATEPQHSTGDPVGTLGAFVDASPSPFHAVATVAAALEAAGFAREAESERWSSPPADGYLIRDGALVAWRVRSGHDATSGFRLIGAHTDSPNLRLKPRPDTGRAGWRQLGVEVYGGALLNSWLDRDLGLSGRVVVRRADSPTVELVRVDEPLARVPQLAIHLDREINDRGLLLNKQQHLAPVWGLAGGRHAGQGFTAWLADRLDAAPDQVVSWDLMFHDLTPSRIVGVDADLWAAPRIDNLASCHAGLGALLDTEPADQVTVLCLFDHEEVGSVSASGAGAPLLARVLRRLVGALDGDDEAFAIACARSFCVSADGAHATHPNYADRHEPDHHLLVNAGPAIKRNANERYATTAPSHAVFVEACQAAGVPHQVFVNRTDLACGSTIGPITSAELGITTVDAGIPQLAMHSARETCGAQDPIWFRAALGAFLRG